MWKDPDVDLVEAQHAGDQGAELIVRQQANAPAASTHQHKKVACVAQVQKIVMRPAPPSSHWTLNTF